MKNKFFNTIMTIALIIIIFSSISFSQSNDNPNNNMNMDNTAMTDSCKMMMGKMKDHMKMNKAMMDSCKMKDYKKMDSAMMDSCKMMMKSPEHKKMMDKMKDHKKMDMTDSSKTMMMKNHKHKMMMGKMKMKGNTSTKASKKMNKKNIMVHKEIIDLKSIDKNKDGFVYQDRMDWNVISDKPGTCPLCGMKLKKYSIEQASKNLIEHGFKVK